jgi:hypothetical protein
MSFSKSSGAAPTASSGSSAPHSSGHSGPTHHKSFWLWVMCLTGVDYFSTLGYQPAIAFDNAGRLSPIATLFLVLVTLFGAVPIYRHVAASSPHGQGSIAMLERLVSGWGGKFLILVLLGFAATDFVITKTLSAADAAVHLLENPIWKAHSPLFLQGQMTVTMILLVALGAWFMRGFAEVIGMAVGIVAVYLGINLILLLECVRQLVTQPDFVRTWFAQVQSGDWAIAHELPVSGSSWTSIVILCFILFPKLALGLSGFETGVAVMPLIAESGATPEERLKSRVQGARKLLLLAAVIMSGFLLCSSLVTATLIPAADLQKDAHAVLDEDKKPTAAEIDHAEETKGPAADRALAYLAHGESPLFKSSLFGNVFGTIYDISTVVILWFAGASAMAGLLNLVPQYLPRYGMAPDWTLATRPLVLLFTIINLFVTWIFRASVDAQGAAYATGVVVLMFSAAIATIIETYRSRTGHWVWRVPWFYSFIGLLFLYTMVSIIIEKPQGMQIASFFIVGIIATSFISRTWRSTELRFTGFEFKDDNDQFLWDSLRHLEIAILVPHRPGGRDLMQKEQSIRAEHHLQPSEPIVFIEVERGDVSEFYQHPTLDVAQQEGRILLRINNCSSIPHVLAAVALEMSKCGKPPEIHFGWSNENPLRANLNFVLFGEGNVPWLVRELILKAEPDPAKQPRVVIG